jgi:hypothetical protein
MPHHAGWPKRDLARLAGLRTPAGIQDYLDSLRYSADPIYRCPLRVLRDGTAHCVDGALFAAAALRRQGHRPLITWITAENDDGHMVALYRRGGLWGALAKSNFVTLRWREPVYRSLRELVMSYFDGYFNTLGQRSMRGYTRAWDLSRFDHLGWECSDRGLGEILDVRLDRLRVNPVLPAGAVPRLRPVDPLAFRAGLLGSRAAGLFKSR